MSGNFIWTDGTCYYYDASNIHYSLSIDRYKLGYKDGYNIGFNSGKEEGKTEGYNQGKSEGYNEGKIEGHTEGYNEGYAKGLADANNYTFFSLIGAIIDAPIQYFQSLFDFTILGVNIKGLLLALFTLCVILVIVRLVKGGR